MLRPFLAWRCLFVCAFLAVPAFASSLVLGEGSRAKLTITRTTGRAATNQWTMRLTVPRLNISDAGDGFSTVMAPGLVPTVDAGTPELAVTGALFAVPPGYRLTAAVRDTQKRTLEGVLARPAQHQTRCTLAQPTSFAFRSDVYAADGPVAPTPLRVETIGNLRGVELVRVAMEPLLQRPMSRRLEVTTSMDVDVRLVAEGRAAPVDLPPSFARLLAASVVNGRDLSALVKVATTESMLVIVADALRKSIDGWVTWKRKTGLHVDVVPTSVAGTTKEAIQAYVKKYWAQNTTKPTYLLVVGNKTSAPAFLEKTSGGLAVSDYRYALLEGGADDLIPDVFFGRLLADNADEASVQTARWVAYERNPKLGKHWRAATTIASSEGSAPSDVDYAKQIETIFRANGFTDVDQFYEGQQTATARNITGAIDEGRTWLSYFGHGIGSAWGSTNDDVDVGVIARLKNADRVPVVIDVACENASWVYFEKPFGKAWVTNRDGGAVGYFGGSATISWHPPAVMSVGIVKAHYTGKAKSLGGVVMAGQLYMLGEMGRKPETLENLKWYNLFGDPALYVPTREPRDYELRQSSKTNAGKLRLSLSVNDDDGNAIEGMRAVITSALGEPVGSAVSDATGSLVVEAPSVDADRITLTGDDFVAKEWGLRFLRGATTVSPR